MIGSLLRCSLAIACLAPAVGCSAVRGEQVETGFTESRATPVVASSQPEVLAGQNPQPPTSDPVGSPLDFTGVEMFGGSPVDGRSMLDSATLVTFVTADCEFSTQHASVLAGAIDAAPDVGHVIVHADTDDGAAREWVDRAGLIAEQVVHLDDADGSLARRFGVTAFPTTLLVHSDGTLSMTEGTLDADLMGEALSIVRG